MDAAVSRPCDGPAAAKFNINKTMVIQFIVGTGVRDPQMIFARTIPQKAVGFVNLNFNGDRGGRGNVRASDEEHASAADPGTVRGPMPSLILVMALRPAGATV